MLPTMSHTHNFYVYGHFKPDGNIFYIGKGHGRRAWRRSGRSNFWHRTVQKHGGYQVVLLHEHLSEDEAFLTEKEEIEFWGRRSDGGFLINLTDGGDGTSGYVYTAEQLANSKAANQKLAQDPTWLANSKAANQKRAREFSVISPDGTLYPNQRNLLEFSKVHGLDDSCMSKVLKGTYTQHNGWKKYIPPSNTHLLYQFI